MFTEKTLENIDTIHCDLHYREQKFCSTVYMLLLLNKIKMILIYEFVKVDMACHLL